MAANSGVKIFRDILRDSPCRRAYKNFTQQYSKNHNLGKAVSLERPSTSARPKTAPFAASPLAHAITAHNLLPEVVVKPTAPERPATSVRTIKPSIGLLCTGGGKSDGKSPPRRPEAPNRQRPPRRPAEPTRKAPPASSSKQGDIRKRPHQRKQLESPDANRNSPKRPCKICISGEDCVAIPEQWQDLLNAYPSKSSASSADADFRHLIGEIETIRSELVSREDVKNISLQESLALINEIQQRINSVSSSSERTTGEGSFLTRLEPAQTATVGSGRRSIIKAKKSVRTLRFEGGRIIEQDYNRGNRRQQDGEKVVPRKAPAKQIEKKFDEGPLRCLLPLVSESLKAAQVKF